MIAQELQLNDWVCIHGEYWRTTIATIQLAWDDPDKVQPIPLTSEILEKNGWVFDEIGGDYYNTEIHFRIYGKESPYMIFDSVEINYVHELQHALKLRKIEKRIIL